MPEYNSSKRRRMTDEELREEYRRSGGKSSAKKKSSASSRREREIIQEARTALPPVSPARAAANKESQARHKQEANRRRDERKRQEKRRNARKRKSMMLYYIMFGLLILAVFTVLSVTVLFNITEIEVAGESVYSDEEIIAAAEVSEGDNLVRFGASSAEERVLEKLVYIDSVSISRSFPNKLIIEVTAAQPMMSVQSGNKYYISSFNGKLLAVSGEPAECPVVKGLSIAEDIEEGGLLTGIDEENAEKLSAVSELISEMNLLSLDKEAVIDITDVMAITMVYDNRISMELGSAARLHEKLYAASVLLETEISANERLTMLLTNPERVVTRPVYGGQTDGDDYIATSEEETEAAEETSSDTE